jgi:ATP-dependent protease ClpP protease subunit
MPTPLIAPLFDYEARILSLLGRIDPSQVDLAVDQLLRCDADSDDGITVFLSCQGGNLIEGLKLVDSIGLLRSRLTAVGLGLIEGAAVLLLASAHQRILFPSALVSTAGLWDLPDLHPQARSGIGLHQQASIRDQLRARLAERINQAMNLSGRRWECLLDPETSPRILTAAQCLELGLADGIVEGPNRILQRCKTKEHRHDRIRLSH